MYHNKSGPGIRIFLNPNLVNFVSKYLDIILDENNETTGKIINKLAIFTNQESNGLFLEKKTIKAMAK